jgi:lysophospholipase L1-like esterase
MTIFVLAPGPNMVFGGAPSGAVYQSNPYNLIAITNNSAADQSFLITAGCAPLTPFSAYTLPPGSAWKPAVTSNLFPVGMTGTANGKLMSCRVHFATTPLSGTIRLTFLNVINLQNIGDYWYASGGPQNMGPITVNGTICYPGPNNVIGAYSATIVNPGAMVDVFVALSATIPGGAKFYEGSFAIPALGQQLPAFGAYYAPNPAQGPYTVNGAYPNTVLGEGVNLSISATDQTANLSSISGTGNAPTYGASAICTVQPLTQSVAAVNGDSLQAGFKGGGDAFNNIGPVSWACGDLVPVLNSAVSGKVAAADAGSGYTGTGYASAMTARLAWYQHCNATHFFNCLGTNDFYAGTSAATIEGYLTTIGNLAAAIGLTPIIATLPPRTTSTDNWATTTNQTVTSNESIRTALNTWVRSTPLPHASFVEFCTPAESSPGSGLWSVPGGTADGIHWGYNVELLVMQQVNVAALTVTTPAQALAYYDTSGRGVHTVQAALDFALSPANLGKEVHLGSAVINFNTTTDQGIALSGPTNYVVTKVVVRDPSISSLNAAQGGLYSSLGKTGALFGTTTTTPFSDVTNTGGAHVFSQGTTARGPTYFSELYVSLTTAQGAAATATVDVYGLNLLP